MAEHSDLSSRFPRHQKARTHALITLDFLEDWLPQSIDAALPVRSDVLVATVAAGHAVDRLSLGPSDIRWLNDVMIHLELELTASTSSLRSFRYDDEMTPGDSCHRQLVSTILKPANGLRELSLYDEKATWLPYNHTTASILRVNDFSKLSTLRLRGAVVPGKGLVEVLALRRPMLHVHLSYVRLIGNDGAWSKVFHTLASMPHLHQLSLSVLRDESLDLRRLVFDNLKNGNVIKGGRMVEYEGEQQVAEGLEELTSTTVPIKVDDDTFGPDVVFRRMGECSVCVSDTE